MDQPLELQVLRNTATLEAWRAYNRKAARPMIFACIFPGIMIGSTTPLMSILMRHHHPMFALALLGGAFAIGMTWLTIAFLQVLAYKRAHPFVPPQSGGWSGRQSRL